MRRAEFLPEIERAKGIGIFLVVVGHLVALASHGPDWYAQMKSVIYRFHMPFFMYLSGFAFAWTRPYHLGTGGWAYMLRRADRLILPFFAFGVFIVVAKYVASLVVYVDDPPAGIVSGVAGLFLNTEASAALSIWYIFVIFIYSVAVFPLGSINNKKILILIITALIINNIHIPDFLYANRVSYFFIFFVVGMAFGANYAAALPIIRRAGPLFLTIFALTLIFSSRTGDNVDWKLICGMASIPPLHYAALVVRGTVARWAQWLGAYTFPIYLMNTLAIGGFKAIYILLLGSMTNLFGLYLIGALLFGIGGPVVFYLALSRSVPRLAAYLK